MGIFGSIFFAFLAKRQLQKMVARCHCLYFDLPAEIAIVGFSRPAAMKSLLSL